MWPRLSLQGSRRASARAVRITDFTFESNRIEFLKTVLNRIESVIILSNRIELGLFQKPVYRFKTGVGPTPVALFGVFGVRVSKTKPVFNLKTGPI